MIFTLLNISLSVSVVIAVLLLLSPLLEKRYAAGWRYFIWLVLAVRVLIPFQVEMPNPLIHIPVPEEQVIYHANTPRQEVPLTQEANGETVDTASVPQPETKALVLTNRDILFFVWLLGALCFMGYHLIGYLLFRKRIRPWCTPFMEGTPSVVLCKKITSPMLTGFFKPIILLPSTSYSTEELESVIAHETTHYERKDLWYKLILVITNAIHWFNPIVYLMMHTAQQDLEYSCDSLVVKGKDLTFRKAYSHAILKSAENKSTSSFTTCFKGGKNNMKKRLINILDRQKKKKCTAALILIICFTMLLSTIAACGDGQSTAKIGGSDGPTNISVYSPDLANKLYSYKNTYVGNNVSVVSIIDLVPHEGYQRETVQLYTDKQPYGVKATYISDGNWSDFIIQKTGAVLLSLVDNADYVELEVKAPDGNDKFSTKLTRESAMEFFQYTFDYAAVTASEESYQKFISDLLAYHDPMQINVAQYSSSVYRQIMELVYDKAIKERASHYAMLGFDTTGYQEETDGNTVTATFQLAEHHKNFYKNPDTVDYIIQANQSGVPYYETLKKEYNEQKTINYEFKVTAALQPDGALQKGSIKLYLNNAPQGYNWEPFDSFLINSPN